MSDIDIIGSFNAEPTITGQLETTLVIQGNVDSQFPAQVSVDSVTTGDPGTDASVTNVGTPGNARLQFTIPRGAQGLQGATGPQGEQGDTGPAGADSTVPGPAGADGVVQSLVAGSNITIDATDPANPIIASTASGSGDVVGPASAVDGTPAVFDGTTGKLIKNITYAAFKTLLSLVKGDVGLGNVDNTSDATKNAATVSLTNKDLTSGTNTFPTLNQNTTGSAAKLTTARNIDGQAFDGTANITVIAPGTHAATSKTTPVDADELPLVDSAASNVLKKLTWANLKAALSPLYATAAQGALADSAVQTLVEGSNITIDATDPNNPIISAMSGSGPWFNVKDYGAVGDGATDDSTAIANAETARSAVGGVLIFPSGKYLYDGQTINRSLGGGWLGFGECRLMPTVNSTTLMLLTSAVVSATEARNFTIEGFHFHFNGKTSITAIEEDAPYHTTIRNCNFTQVQYSCLMIGANSSTQTGWVNISNIHQTGSGSWCFLGYDDTKYIFNINIENFNQQGTGASAWTGATQLFLFRRCASAYLTNINAASLDGAARGIYLLGDCQGIFLDNVIIGWPTYGIKAEAWTDTLIPSYVYISNCGMDQPTVSGFDIAGRTWFINNSNATNGYLRSSTNAACRVRSTATDIAISNSLFAYMNDSGLVVENGAKKVRINGITSENNNQIAGSNYEVDLGASPFTDVILYGRNVFGAAGVNATGQRVVNGVTSKEVSRNTGSVATTAVTTSEDLMTYTIPANTLQPGQKIKLTAWGKTAANTNTKTIRLWFGGNSVLDHNGAWNNLWWRLESIIFITGASTQEYSSIASVTATAISVRTNALTVTDTSTIIAKCTGQNGTASAGDITCEGFTVEIVD